MNVLLEAEGSIYTRIACRVKTKIECRKQAHQLFPAFPSVCGLPESGLS
jgi:hypothetical protein